MMIAWARPWVVAMVSAALFWALWAGSAWAFSRAQIFISPLYPFVIVWLNFACLSLFKFYLSEKDRRFIKKAFSNYVADDVVREIVKNPGSLKLGGEVKNATVLFCDLANFTNISENRSPHEIVDIMGRYFEDTTQIVFNCRGTLMEYVGDELMAVFGAPISLEDQEREACRTALAIQAYLRERGKTSLKTGLPVLAARVGVNTGEMLVGNLGSKYRFCYGVMGDNVNLASRLEGLNKIYGTKIIIGQNTAARVKDEFLLRNLGAIRVKGRLTPENAYELVGGLNDPIEEARLRSMALYEEGYGHYVNQEWDRAIDLFEKGLALQPGDLSFKVLIQRCGMYRQMPYIENFDGVFIERRK